MGGAQVFAPGDALPPFDLHCPLLSLPLAFGTRLDTIPATAPYLTTPPQSLEQWGVRLGPEQRRRIGLVWAGNEQHLNDRNRSIALTALLPLLEIDAAFISLQKEIRPGDAAVLAAHKDILSFSDKLATFDDTAALISHLDLVISVDTSVAHLAGALGKPVWVLLPHIPDWRWLLDRDDSPWYPTARLFRQNASRSWDSVIPRVMNALRQFLADPK